MHVAQQEDVLAAVVVEVRDHGIDDTHYAREPGVIGIRRLEDLRPRHRRRLVDPLRIDLLVRAKEVERAVVVRIEQLAVVEIRADELCRAGHVRKGAVGTLVVQLRAAVELRHHEIEQLVAVVVEPHRLASAQVRRRQPLLRRAVDQALVLVVEQLFRVAGAGADEQVLVAVVVDVGERPAVRVGVLVNAPGQDLRCNLVERVPFRMFR